MPSGDHHHEHRKSRRKHDPFDTQPSTPLASFSLLHLISKPLSRLYLLFSTSSRSFKIRFFTLIILVSLILYQLHTESTQSQSQPNPIAKRNNLFQPKPDTTKPTKLTNKPQKSLKSSSISLSNSDNTPSALFPNDKIIALGTTLLEPWLEFGPLRHQDNPRKLAEIIAGVIQYYNITSVVDLSCRYTEPVFTVLHPLLHANDPNYVYKCFDSSSIQVRKMYERAMARQFKNWFFYRRDFTEMIGKKPMPHSDLVIAFDLLQTLSASGIQMIFDKILEGQSKWMLFTSNPGRKNPVGEKTWKFARMDFHREPYLLGIANHVFSGISLNNSHSTCPKVLELLELSKDNLGRLGSTGAKAEVER